jgi:hypothetical protein
MTIFEEILKLGIEYSNHYSDLCVPVTKDTTEILRKHGYTSPASLEFKNQSDGKWWYDVPFSYDPFWELNLGK